MIVESPLSRVGYRLRAHVAGGTPACTDGYDDNKGTNDLSVHPSLLHTALLPSLFADRSGQEVG